MTKIKAGVIGYPIKHSLSPIIHNFWLNQYGIDGSYERIEVKPEDLDDFLENGIKEYAGVNVTIPHKVEVFEKVPVGGFPTGSLSDIYDKITNDIKAANTIVNKNNNLYCYNTDWYGFSRNLEESLNNTNQEINDKYFDVIYLDNKKIFIIGAGGAARAILGSFVNNHNYNEIYIYNRTFNKSEDLANNFMKHNSSIKVIPIRFDKDINLILEDIDLLVNTSSLGMTGQPELEIDISSLKKSAVVTDIVYNPLETKLLRDAKNQGNRTVDGLGMLLHQAAPGFESWFGVRPRVTPELREHVIKKLGL
jgi:shikimate dehydrogenase